MIDWQPIETAPKDGTEVLCWVGENEYYGGWVALRYLTKYKVWIDWDGDPWEPLYWAHVNVPGHEE